MGDLNLMLPIITGREGDLIKIEVMINVSGSMLEAEESILRGVNAVGIVATGEALKRFDADGDPIVVGGVKLYSKGKLPKIYNTPYGVVSAERHVYQPAEGGKTFCPMDDGARIIRKATPRFAKIVSHNICPQRCRRGAGRPGAEPWPALPQGQFAGFGHACRDGGPEQGRKLELRHSAVG